MKKKEYMSPRIETILLDAEISLQLESNPPEGPGEGSLGLNNNIAKDTFKIDFV